MSVRFALRELTQNAHDRVDALLSQFDLTDRDQYGEFLSVQAAAFLPIEAALDTAGAVGVLPDWPERRRSDALRADLAALDRLLPDPIAPPPYPDAPAIWGVLYVLEGSRLGAAMLRKTVPPELPQSFLAHAPPKSAWASIVAALERNLGPDVMVRRAGEAALATFACFEQAYEGLKLNELD